MRMTAFASGDSRYNFFTRAIASVLVGLLLAPATAIAAPAPTAAPASRPKLAVIGFFAEEGVAKQAVRLEWEAEQNARRTNLYEVIDLAAHLDAEGHAEREKNAEEARKSFVAAKGAYDELEVQLAVDLCDRAMGLYEKSDITRTLPDMVKAWTLKIAALIANADTRTSDIEENLLLPLDVEPNFDPNLFAPDFIAQNKRKKEALEEKANLSIDVATRPVPARVYVDGKFRGISPVEVRNLAPGEHFVTLFAPGYKMVQSRARAGAAASVGEALEPTPAHPKFQSLVQRIQQSFRHESRAAPSRELAQMLGVDQLVYVSVNREGPGAIHVAAARVRGSDGAEIAFQEETLTDDEPRLANLSQGLFTRLLTTDERNHSLARALGASSAPRGGSSSGVLRYTGYGLIGGGVAALALGVVMGVLANSAQNEYQSAAVPQTSPQLGALQKTGESRALYADLSFLGAILLGGAGGVMVALDNRATSVRADGMPTPAPAPRQDERPAAVEPKPAAVERGPAPKVEEKPAPPAPAPKVEEKPAPPAPAPKVEEKKPTPPPPPAPKAEEKKPAPPPPAPKPEEKKDELPGAHGRFKDEYLDDFRDDD